MIDINYSENQWGRLAHEPCATRASRLQRWAAPSGHRSAMSLPPLRCDYRVRHVQASDSQLADFETFDFCAADDQPANRYESAGDRAKRNPTDLNPADRLCADRQ